MKKKSEAGTNPDLAYQQDQKAFFDATISCPEAGSQKPGASKDDGQEPSSGYVEKWPAPDEEASRVKARAQRLETVRRCLWDLGLVMTQPDKESPIWVVYDPTRAL